MSRAELHNFLRNHARDGYLPLGAERVNIGDHSKPDPTKVARIALESESLARIESITRESFKAQPVDATHLGAHELDKAGFEYFELPQLLRVRIHDIGAAWEELLQEALGQDAARSAKQGCSTSFQTVYSTLVSTFGSTEGLYDQLLPGVMALEISKMAQLAVNKFPAALGYNPNAVQIVELMRNSFFSYLAPLTTIDSDVAFDRGITGSATIELIGGKYQMILKPATLEAIAWMRVQSGRIKSTAYECPFNTPSRLLKPFLDPTMEPARVSAMHETFQIFMDKLLG